MVGRVRTAAGILLGRLTVCAAALAAFLVCAHGAGAADLQLAPPPLSFVVAPEITFPLGPGQQNFLPGAAARIGVEYSLPSIPFLSIETAALVGFTPITDGLGTTGQLGGFLGAAWRLPIAGPLSARAFARAGYEAGLVYGDPLSRAGGAPAAEAGLGASLLLTPSLALRLDGSWMYVLGANGSAVVSLSIVARPRPGRPQPAGAGSPRTGLSIGRVELTEIYPALRRSYLNHPVGTVTIANTGGWSVSDVHVSVRVAGLMEKPRESAERPILKPGETWRAPVFVALDSAAERGSASTAQAEISVTYLEAGERWEIRHGGELRVMDPRALVDSSPSTGIQAAASGDATPGAAAPDGTSPAARPPRRLLVAFTARPAAGLSEMQRVSVADSLFLALQRAGVGILVIPYGSGWFPDSDDARVEAARKAGADCYLVVSAGNAGTPGTFSVETFDTLNRTAEKATVTGETNAKAAPDLDWSPIVSLLGRAYGG